VSATMNVPGHSLVLGVSGGGEQPAPACVLVSPSARPSSITCVLRQVLEPKRRQRVKNQPALTAVLAGRSPR